MPKADIDEPGKALVPWLKVGAADDGTGEPSKETHVTVTPALLPHTSLHAARLHAARLNCSSGYKLNFNAIWVLYVEGVIVVAAVGERIPFVVETRNVVV